MALLKQSHFVFPRLSKKLICNPGPANKACENATFYRGIFY